MALNIGRLMMLCVWIFMVINLVQPYPRPLNIFVNIALVFTVIMHGLQITLLQSTLSKEAPKLTFVEKARLFLFGVFELLAWQKKHFPPR